MYQHPSEWHNNTGVIRQAEALQMGIILMRPLTGGVLKRLVAEAFPQLDTLDAGRLPLNHVLSDPYVDVALAGIREPRFVDLTNDISDDVASRIDLAALHDRYVRYQETLEDWQLAGLGAKAPKAHKHRASYKESVIRSV